VDLFRKDISGGYETKSVDEPFTALGYPYAVPPLSPPQYTAIANEGGPGVAQVIVDTPENSPANLYITGAEIIWVQPLDFVVRGTGITANYTHLAQHSWDPANIALGISPRNYNFGGYYENYGFSLHVTYVYQAANVVATAPQDNLNLPLIADPHGQVDMQASYSLPYFGATAVQLFFDAKNLNNEPIRTHFGYDNETYSVYFPGRLFILGARAKF
jgi:outer membrane receptor protein involved in Fe transport